VPTPGKLELDVVTCHHRDYYGGKLQVATDTEEPNPVLFPAVAPGHVFTFALHKLRNGSAAELQRARTWLQTGLQTFGLGAKTNAGYGWFWVVTQEPEGTWHVVHDEGRSELPSPSPSPGPAIPQTPNPPPSDYESETVFRNTVLNRLDRPQDYGLLQPEILTLQKPANASWLKKLKDFLARPDAKEARKRLKQRDWFPKDWLPG
jgi:hypothetical protein